MTVRLPGAFLRQPAALLVVTAVVCLLGAVGCGPDPPTGEDAGDARTDVATDSGVADACEDGCECEAPNTSSESKCSDGRDDDCDGKTDCEDPDCAGSACGIGQGTAKWVSGACKETVCSDGFDNDEDGNTDCRDGNCTDETCAKNTDRTCPPPSKVEDNESLCDALDNDCDGAADEGCACVYDPTETANVDTDGSNDHGVCQGQTREQDGTCLEPSDFDRTQVEGDAGLCDSMDNDCDGSVDEGCACTYDPDEQNNVDTDGSHGDGVCTNQPLNADGNCTKPNKFESRTPSESSCDGADNDCDGSTDDKCPCTYDPGETNNVDTDQSNADGVCLNQSRDANGVCKKPSAYSDPEKTLCDDGKDNDCDGSTDETATSIDHGKSCSTDCQCKTGPCFNGTCAQTIRVADVDVTGNLGGVTGADRKCGPGEGALVSVDAKSAESRLDFGGPIVNANGKKVADGRLDLFDASGTLDNPITNRKHLVWTGTKSNGDASRSDCVKWTSSNRNDSATFGRSSDTSNNWVDVGSEFNCNAGLDLYCITGQ